MQVKGRLYFSIGFLRLWIGSRASGYSRHARNAVKTAVHVLSLETLPKNKFASSNNNKKTHPSLIPPSHPSHLLSVSPALFISENLMNKALYIMREKV